MIDLLHLLINTEKSFFSTCFLCFKRDINNMDIYTIFEIHNQYKIISVTLTDMLKTLFPYQEFLLHQACRDCADLISKLYILMNKHKFKYKLLHNIVQFMDRRIEDIVFPEENGKAFINLKELKSLDLKYCKPAGDAVNQNNNDNTFLDIPLTCEICSKTFETTESFKLHQGDHKENSKATPDCLEIFHKSDLQSAATYNCRTDKKKYKRKKIYHYCNDCTYKTLSKSTLQAHINKHHLQTRPHICQLCFKGFYNRSNLNEHVKTHSGERNEICDVCGCSFLHKKNLEEHLRLHSDTRPYECNICNKKFVTSGRRSDHIKRSHMERTECCVICNKKYSLKKELTRHMNNVHLRT